jgi:hypothetical protein
MLLPRLHVRLSQPVREQTASSTGHHQQTALPADTLQGNEGTDQDGAESAPKEGAFPCRELAVGHRAGADERMRTA